MEFLTDKILSVSDELLFRDSMNLTFIGVNIMAFVLSKMIAEVLARYTKTANIPERFRPRINMKNEFLFTRIILANARKRYLTSVRLREGTEIYPEKIDVKGHEFVKSGARIATKKYFERMVDEKLLHADKIDISEILKGMEDFENMVKESLYSGKKEFLLPKSVKELEGYKNPLAMEGVRGVIAWNYLFPDMEIQLPDKIDIIKVKMTTLDEIEPLKETNPKLYDRIVKYIFNNPNKDIAKKGIDIISLPHSVEKVPEWVMPYIDYDTIINDNVSKFNSVLESLGISIIKATSTKKYFSNILNI